MPVSTVDAIFLQDNLQSAFTYLSLSFTGDVERAEKRRNMPPDNYFSSTFLTLVGNSMDTSGGKRTRHCL